MAECRIVNLEGKDVDFEIWLSVMPASGLIAIQLGWIGL